MAQDFTSALDRQIAELERQINALRQARQALSGGGGPSRVRAGGKRRPGQRTFTAAQRAEQSRKMRLYWAKRRKDGQKG
jgi:hypothetical protein